jgi:hypothetical protein
MSIAFREYVEHYDPGKGYNSPMEYIPGDKLT